MYNMNPFNPYQGLNPAYLQNSNMHTNNNQIIKVNGKGGADAYQMPPNSQVLLLDETQPLLWLKQTDGAGYPSLTAYDIKPHEEMPVPDIKNIEQRITKIEEVLKNEPYFADNSRKISDAGTGAANVSNDKDMRRSAGFG